VRRSSASRGRNVPNRSRRRLASAIFRGGVQAPCALGKKIVSGRPRELKGAGLQAPEPTGCHIHTSIPPPDRELPGERGMRAPWDRADSERPSPSPDRIIRSPLRRFRRNDGQVLRHSGQRIAGRVRPDPARSPRAEFMMPTLGYPMHLVTAASSTLLKKQHPVATVLPLGQTREGRKKTCRLAGA